MHLFWCIVVGLVVLGTGMLLLAFYSKTPDPSEEENGKVRQLYPDKDDPDYAYDNDNTPIWKLKRAQNN